MITAIDAEDDGCGEPLASGPVTADLVGSRVIRVGLPALLVTPEGRVSAIELPADNVLHGLYAAIVCARVDVVSLVDDLDMWIDDDGRDVREPNLPATIIACSYGFTHQPFWGPVVFTGGVDGEGQTLGLRPELATHLQRTLFDAGGLLAEIVQVAIDRQENRRD